MKLTLIGECSHHISVVNGYLERRCGNIGGRGIFEDLALEDIRLEPNQGQQAGV